MNLSYIPKVIIIIFFLVKVAYPADNTITLHPYVGRTIDIREREYYNLFSDTIPQFYHAELKETKNGYCFEISSKIKWRNIKDTLRISPAKITKIQERIIQKGPVPVNYMNPKRKYIIGFGITPKSLVRDKHSDRKSFLSNSTFAFKIATDITPNLQPYLRISSNNIEFKEPYNYKDPKFRNSICVAIGGQYKYVFDKWKMPIGVFTGFGLQKTSIFQKFFYKKDEEGDIFHEQKSTVIGMEHHLGVDLEYKHLKITLLFLMQRHIPKSKSKPLQIGQWAGFTPWIEINWIL